MRPRVNDGARVTLEPIGERALCIDDIVLVRVGGRDYLHLIKAVQGERYLIGNNRGGINGWVGRSAVYGRAVAIDDGDDG